jgi:hypothetical protein
MLLISLLFLICLVPVFLWYSQVIHQIQSDVVYGLFDTSNKEWPGLMQTAFYVFRVIFPLILLNQGAIVAFWLGAILIIWNKKIKHFWFKPLLILSLTTVAYYLFEIKPIGINHDYYLFPFLPLIFIPAALGFEKLLEMRWLMTRVFAVVMLVSLPFYSYQQMKDRWSLDACIYYSWFLKDIDSFKNRIPEKSLIVVGFDPSSHFYLYHLERKGWVIKDDIDLKSFDMKEAIDGGAEFIISNNRKIDKETGHIRPYLGDSLYEMYGFRLMTLRKNPAIDSIKN